MIMRQLPKKLVFIGSKMQFCSQRYNFISNDFSGYHSTRRIQRNHNIHLGTLRRLRRHMKNLRHNPSYQGNDFDGKGNSIQDIKTEN